MLRHIATAALLLTPVMAPPADAQMRPPDPEVTFPDGVTSIEVPIEVQGHLITLPVRADDYPEPLRFVLDSGASGAVLRQRDWVERLGLPVLGEARVAGGGTGEMGTATIAGPATLHIGALEMRLGMIVAGVGEHMNEMRWDGAVGAGLLAKTVAEIDYEHSVLRLHDPAHFVMPVDAVVIPTERLSNRLSAVEAAITIDGVTTRRWLVVDLGAFHALSLNAEDGELPSRRYDEPVVLGYGTQGPLPGHVGVIDSIELGDVTLRNVVTTFPGPEGMRDIRKLTEDDVPVTGNLGSAILRRYTVIVDHPGKRLGLRPRSTPAPAFHFTTTGLLSRPGTTERGFELERVLPGTPAAEAGLVDGDVIVTLDGEPVAGRGLEIREQLMDPPPGKRLEITYLHPDGEGREVERQALILARPLFPES